MTEVLTFIICFDRELQRDIEAEMRRLKLELKQTMDMYSTACKEALTAKRKVILYHHNLNFSVSVNSINNIFQENTEILSLNITIKN